MPKKLLLFLLLLALPALAWAQVDLNRADAKMLAEAMTGVGLTKAEAIVAYRDAHGPFRSIDELAKVKGIGAKTIAANRDAIVVIDPDDGGEPPADGGGSAGVRPAASQ
ncbi:ComEA family DNA-binding protein [Dokdonella ginsengisoli]|uniref:ComEA family DNA-binding protein n=2 Tax=Dokdonella ginsengisoli TaxID=363846 RepID=A0ABV9QRG9_9GAMM